MQKIKIKGRNCIVVKEEYTTGNPCLSIYEEKTGDLYMVPTVNISGYDNQTTFIKDYAENEGILNLLVENKIVDNLGWCAPLSQYTKANAVNILI